MIIVCSISCGLYYRTLFGSNNVLGQCDDCTSTVLFNLSTLGSTDPVQLNIYKRIRCWSHTLLRI